LQPELLRMRQLICPARATLRQDAWPLSLPSLDKAPCSPHSVSAEMRHPMSQTFESIDEAFNPLGNPSAPAWGAAFAYLCAHAETAELMLETFRETLETMGVEPSGTDAATGEPSYNLKDIARAMGMPESDLDAAVGQVPGADG
jgi:hypothetical protein